MLPFLLAGCALFAPAPKPLPLSVGLPTAQHAGSIPARDFLHLLHGAAPSDTEHEALCAWMRGEAEDDRIAETLHARGDMGFALLELSGAEIRLGGTVVMPLTDGVVPAEERRGMMVSRLYDGLLDQIETRKSTAARCQIPTDESRTLPVLVAVDPGVPYETVTQLLYTAGQAQVGAFYVVVDGPAGAPLPSGPPDDADRQLIATFQDGGSRRYSQITRPGVTPLPEALDQATSLLGGDPLGCGLLVPQGQTRWSAVVSEFDAFARSGARRFVLATAAEDSSGPTAAAPLPPAALALGLSTTVPAFLVELPALGPPSVDGDPHAGSECDPFVQAVMEFKKPPGSQGNQGILDALEGVDVDAIFGSSGLGLSGIGTSGGRSPVGNSDIVERATLTLGSATVDGPFPPEVLEWGLRRHRNQLRYCYQRQLGRDGPLSGEMTVRFALDSSGLTSRVGVTEDTVSREVATCVKERIERLHLPKQPDDLPTTVTIPLTFSLEAP